MADDEKPRSLVISIDAVRETNFGDHGAMMRESHEVVPGETVEEMVLRVFKIPSYRQMSPVDWIEVKVQVAADGKPAAPEMNGPPF